MTLNIAVAARWLIVQSSDFRLTRSGIPVADAAQKQVVLHSFGWSGLVCYTGIASWGKHDTASWLERVLAQGSGREGPRDVVERITVEGSKWLSRVRASERFHTFTMVAYERRIPHVYVISNFERAGVRLPDPLDHFVISHLRPRRPRCLVTGWSNAVLPEQRADLEVKLGLSPAPEAMRLAVARISRDAAQRSEGRVGESCVASHILPDGSGEAQVFGNLNSEFVPVMFANGANVALVVPAVMQEAGAVGPSRLVGVTWTQNRSPSIMLGAFRELFRQTGDGWPSDSG